MTELQKIFLSYVFIFYLIKGTLYVLLYVALIVAEKHARQRHEKFIKWLRKERTDEQSRWKVAYNLYEKQNDFPKAKPLGLSELVTNPNSFTTYSTVKFY
jgi:hypothetical protein